MLGPKKHSKLEPPLAAFDYFPSSKTSPMKTCTFACAIVAASATAPRIELSLQGSILPTGEPGSNAQWVPGNMGVTDHILPGFTAHFLRVSYAHIWQSQSSYRKLEVRPKIS